MAYLYEPGATRWKKYTGSSDIRGYQAPRYWQSHTELTDIHPVTGRQLKRSQWWIRETYTGCD